MRWASSLEMWLAGDDLKVSERAVPWWVNSRNNMWGSFEATETSVLGEEVMNNRKTVHETILFLNIRFCS